MKYTSFFLVIVASVNCFSQEQKLVKKDTSYSYKEYIIFEGDTVVIELDEVTLLGKLKFQNNYDRRYYYWFRKKTLKAYPYAKLAAQRLNILNERLDGIESKRKRKKYTKIIQNYMEEEFTEQLKKLTKTEGRILIKLIHRQTGFTTFDLIKEIRSGWKAFWYHSTAKMFKLSLKVAYDPENINEDYLIEDILQRAFIDGFLEKQESMLRFDYAKTASKKRNLIHIEKKK
jgi:signal peptidase I